MLHARGEVSVRNGLVFCAILPDSVPNNPLAKTRSWRGVSTTGALPLPGYAPVSLPGDALSAVSPSAHADTGAPCRLGPPTDRAGGTPCRGARGRGRAGQQERSGHGVATRAHTIW